MPEIQKNETRSLPSSQLSFYLAGRCRDSVGLSKQKLIATDCAKCCDGVRKVHGSRRSPRLRLGRGWVRMASWRRRCISYRQVEGLPSKGGIASKGHIPSDPVPHFYSPFRLLPSPGGVPGFLLQALSPAVHSTSEVRINGTPAGGIRVAPSAIWKPGPAWSQGGFQGQGVKLLLETDFCY